MGFFPPHSSSSHEDITFFTVWKTFSLFSCLYKLIPFLLQVYTLICKQTSISHKLASFRKCLFLLLLSNALKWRYYCMLEYSNSWKDWRRGLPMVHLFFNWLHWGITFLLNKPCHIYTFYHHFTAHSSFSFPCKKSIRFYFSLCIFVLTFLKYADTFCIKTH